MEQALKPQELDIGNMTSIRMEYGILGRVKIEAPWNRIRSGRTAVNVNDVHLVCRISNDRNQKSNSSWLHDRKMV